MWYHWFCFWTSTPTFRLGLDQKNLNSPKMGLLKGETTEKGHFQWVVFEILLKGNVTPLNHLPSIFE